jgi:hypothetical protein
VEELAFQMKVNLNPSLLKKKAAEKKEQELKQKEKKDKDALKTFTKAFKGLFKTDNKKSKAEDK